MEIGGDNAVDGIKEGVLLSHSSSFGAASRVSVTCCDFVNRKKTDPPGMRVDAMMCLNDYG